jgi:uncharacterized protein YpbB
MISYQQRLAVYTSLLAELHGLELLRELELHELELLRERVKKAERLHYTSRRTAVERGRGVLSRTTPRASASATNYRLRLPRSQ